MKNYRPKSWSVQAREMCDKQVEAIAHGYQTIEGAIAFFAISYRAPIIRYRAVTRFMRLVKAGKVVQGELAEGIAESIERRKELRKEYA